MLNTLINTDERTRLLTCPPLFCFSPFRTGTAASEAAAPEAAARMSSAETSAEETPASDPHSAAAAADVAAVGFPAATPDRLAATAADERLFDHAVTGLIGILRLTADFQQLLLEEV